MTMKMKVKVMEKVKFNLNEGILGLPLKVIGRWLKVSFFF